MDLAAFCAAQPATCRSTRFWYEYYRDHYRSAVEYHPSWNYYQFIRDAETRINTVSDNEQIYICIKYNYDVLLRQALPAVGTTEFIHELFYYAMSFPYTNQLDILVNVQYTYKKQVQTLDARLSNIVGTVFTHPLMAMLRNHRNMDVDAFAHIFENKYMATTQALVAGDTAFANTYQARVAIFMDDSVALGKDVKLSATARLYRVIGANALQMYQLYFSKYTVAHLVIALAYRRPDIVALIGTVVIRATELPLLWKTWAGLNEGGLSPLALELSQVAYHLTLYLTPDGIAALNNVDSSNVLAAAMWEYLN